MPHGKYQRAVLVHLLVLAACLEGSQGDGGFAALEGEPEDDAPITNTSATWPQHTPEAEEQKKRAGHVVGWVASAAVIGGFGPGPLSGMRLAVTAQMCDPFFADPEARYPAELAPAEFLWTYAHTPMNAMLGNIVVMAVASVLAYLMGLACTRYASKESVTRCNAHSALTFPSAQIHIVQVLYQATVLAAFDLLFEHIDAQHVLAGLFGCTVCAAIPAIIYSAVRRAVPEKARVVGPPESEMKPHSLQVFLCGDGEWVSSSAYDRWVDAWGAVVRPYKETRYWYFFIDFGASAAVAVTHAAVPRSMVGCGHTKLFAGLVYLALLAATAWYRPYIHPHNTTFTVLLLAVLVVAMTLLAAGYYGEDFSSPVFSAAGALLIGCAISYLLWTAVNVVVWLAVALSGRRARFECAQEEEERDMITTGSFFNRASALADAEEASKGVKRPVNARATFALGKEQLPLLNLSASQLRLPHPGTFRKVAEPLAENTFCTIEASPPSLSATRGPPHTSSLDLKDQSCDGVRWTRAQSLFLNSPQPRFENSSQQPKIPVVPRSVLEWDVASLSPVTPDSPTRDVSAPSFARGSSTSRMQSELVHLETVLKRVEQEDMDKTTVLLSDMLNSTVNMSDVTFSKLMLSNRDCAGQSSFLRSSPPRRRRCPAPHPPPLSITPVKSSTTDTSPRARSLTDL